MMRLRFMIRNKWLWLAVVVVLLLAAGVLAYWPVTQPSDAEVVVQPGTQKVEAGQELTERVAVRSDLPANAVDITLSYPPDILEVVSTSNAKGRFDMQIFPIAVNKDNGTVRFLQATVAPFSGPADKGYVGEIVFKAKKDGEVEVKVSQAKVVANSAEGTDLTAKKADKKLWETILRK